MHREALASTPPPTAALAPTVAGGGAASNSSTRRKFDCAAASNRDDEFALHAIASRRPSPYVSDFESVTGHLPPSDGESTE